MYGLDLPPDPPTIVGKASVIDGDTLEIHGQRIRLWGVDAPEARQSCERAGRAYRCGTESANALSNWIGPRTVSCTPQGRPDRYRRIVALCTVAGRDVGAWLVRSGWAVDYPRYSRQAYSADQDFARLNRQGVWAGTFAMPWDWRR